VVYLVCIDSISTGSAANRPSQGPSSVKILGLNIVRRPKRHRSRLSSPESFGRSPARIWPVDARSCSAAFSFRVPFLVREQVSSRKSGIVCH